MNILLEDNGIKIALDPEEIAMARLEWTFVRTILWAIMTISLRLAVARATLGDEKLMGLAAQNPDSLEAILGADFIGRMEKAIAAEEEETPDE